MWKAPSTNDLLSIYEPTEEDIYSPASRNPMSYGTDDDDENDNSVKINLLELHQSQKSKTKPKKQKKQKKAKNTFVQERELQTSPTRQEQQLDMLEQNSAQQVAGIWQTKPLLTEVHFNFSNCLQQYVNLDSNTKPSYFFQSMALASQYKDAYQKELKKTDRACYSVFKRMDEKYPDLYRDEFVKLNSYADLNLTRTGAACCVHKNKLFVYGGSIGSKVLGDLLSFDLATHTWTLHHNIGGKQHAAPPMTNHIMVSMDEGIAIASMESNSKKKIMAYAIRTIGEGENMMLEWYWSSSGDEEDNDLDVNCELDFDPRKHAAPVVYSEKIFMFCGEASNGTIIDEFIRIEFYFGSGERKMFNYDSLKLQALTATTPPIRKCHSACAIADGIIIYGGIGKNNQYLNDMHFYHEKQRKWTEIEITGIVPPPMIHHTMLYVPSTNSAFIIGGETAQGKWGDMSLFDFNTNKFSVVTSQLNRKVIPRLKHAVIANTTQGILIVGGISRKGKRHEFSYLRGISSTVKQSSTSLMNYMNNLFKSGSLSDIKVVHQDKNHGMQEWLLHKTVFAARCPAFYDAYNMDTATTIAVTEFAHYETISEFLRFIYTGCMQLEEPEFIAELCDKCTKYDCHPDTVRRICTGTMNSKYLQDAYEEWRSDFHSILQTGFGADFKVQANDADEPIAVHKIFLTRLDHMKTVLSSYFKEAQDQLVVVEELSESGLQALLRWMYSDYMDQVTNYNVAEVYLYACQYCLEDLLLFSTDYIQSHLDVTNACSVLELAMMHDDKFLFSECFKIVRANYDDIIKSDDYLQLSEAGKTLMTEQRNQYMAKVEQKKNKHKQSKKYQKVQ